jgi:holo-[acyl-carrier protein] synthase
MSIAGSALVGLGIDEVEVPRFARLLERRPRLADRLFTPGEREYCSRLANPVPSLAARFAAKEAVMKALGVGLGSFAWRDVEVVRQPEGRPVLSVVGRAAELAAAAGVGGWQVSLTHTNAAACAVVAAVS